MKEWMEQVHALGVSRLTVARCERHHHWVVEGTTRTGLKFVVHGEQVTATLHKFLAEFPRA
jgi:hypothetical protein